MIFEVKLSNEISRAALRLIKLFTGGSEALASTRSNGAESFAHCETPSSIAAPPLKAEIKDDFRPVFVHVFGILQTPPSDLPPGGGVPVDGFSPGLF